MLNKGHGRKVQNTVADNKLPITGEAIKDFVETTFMGKKAGLMSFTDSATINIAWGNNVGEEYKAGYL